MWRETESERIRKSEGSDGESSVTRRLVGTREGGWRRRDASTGLTLSPLSPSLVQPLSYEEFKTSRVSCFNESMLSPQYRKRRSS